MSRFIDSLRFKIFPEVLLEIFIASSRKVVILKFYLLFRRRNFIFINIFFCTLYLDLHSKIYNNCRVLTCQFTTIVLYPDCIFKIDLLRYPTLIAIDIQCHLKLNLFIFIASRVRVVGYCREKTKSMRKGNPILRSSKFHWLCFIHLYCTFAVLIH